MSIEGKVVIVTGAGCGIGRSTASCLAFRGAVLVVAACQDSKIAAVARDIEGAGGQAIHWPTNVTRRADLQSPVDLAYDRSGRLDVLVNNAGIGPVSRF